MPFAAICFLVSTLFGTFTLLGDQLEQKEEEEEKEVKEKKISIVCPISCKLLGSKKV